ncbi:reverse transcriptase domain-containing protein, partial [Tanacetum coccineum]
MLRACPHHGFTKLTQVDTFYNGLNDNDQDSLNAAAGGNLLSKTTREALNIIENKSKVRYSRNKPNASRMNTTSSKTDERINKLADQLSTLVEIISKKVVTPAPVKAVEETCVTCGGAHSWYNCPPTDNNQASVCATTGTYNQVNPPNRVSNQMASLGFAPVQNNGQNRFNHNQVQGNNFNRGNNFHGNQALTSGTLPSNTIPNPKGEMKAITTRSGVAYEGPSIPTNPSPKKVVERETEETTDKEQTNFQGSTAQIPPPVIPISILEPDVPKTLPKTTPIPESDVPKSLPKPNIPYPSRRDDQKSRDKASNQMEKIFQIFQDLRFDISFADALLLMPRFAPTIKSLLMNKEKLLELAKIQLNENCSAMLLKKLPEKLGDPGKFLIPCNFPRIDVCHALADLGASINLMPLSIWKKLSLPELTPTRMTLELADRSITHPKGVAEDIFVKVGNFHFPTDFVVVDFEADPRDSFKRFTDEPALVCLTPPEDDEDEKEKRRTKNDRVKYEWDAKQGLVGNLKSSCTDVAKTTRKRSKPDKHGHGKGKSAKEPECMHTRNSNFPNNSNVTILRHRNKGRAPNIVEPELRAIVAPMAERTMEELLRAPTEGYGEAIVLPEINADHFEIKTNLLQFQANPFHGNVPNDVLMIKLMMFPYSLEGAAKTWYEKEPPNSILTWEDLVTKFVNQFFPPSKTTHLKNEISRFTQKFEETFSEAWEQFKEMLRACPHHEFMELTQVDTFYNGLNDNDQDSLNAATGGNLLSKTTREALNIIENKSKVRYSRNKSNVSRMNTTFRESVSKTDKRIDKLADQLSTLVEIVSKKVVTPAPVKAVEETCVTCGGAHSWNEAKAITTRSGISYDGPPIPPPVVEKESEVPKDTELPSTEDIQPPPLVQEQTKDKEPIEEPSFIANKAKPNLPYPSRLNKQKIREKDDILSSKFMEIFRNLHFE